MGVFLSGVESVVLLLRDKCGALPFGREVKSRSIRCNWVCPLKVS